MIADYHIHTKFSCDSEANLEDYIECAKEKNIKALCFTDHVDFNKNDYGVGYYNPDEFFGEYNQARLMADDEMMIGAGIEFSEPHLYNDKLRELGKYPYDYIIGSVHWIGDMFPCHEVREKYSAKEFYILYWNEVLAMVQNGGFDCVGHIDFPKRYYGKIYYDEKVMREIFQEMLGKNIILEINTSSLRKGINESMPGKELLQLYIECGGKYVTVGSDAHEVKDLGVDFEKADRLIKELGLKKVIFKQRKRIGI